MVTKEIYGRYQRARKKDKITILDEFCNLTKYNRSYASYILRNYGRKFYLRKDGELIAVLIGGPTKSKKYKPKLYNGTTINVLKKIWYICDCICGKRLAPAMKDVIPILEKYEEIVLNNKTRQLLFAISPATIDRALKEERKKYILKVHKSRTKPGTLLKHQIPIRTFSEWNDKRPGFVEMDLVGHDNGNIQGEYAQTLDLTDIATTWTETQAVRNKAQVWVFEALEHIRKQLPFDILGIDSDNGSEFINDHLFSFCTNNKITFTRSRAYRKNDNCFVEQKNYSIVRRYTGYLRYDTEKELNLLNELYKYLRLYTNFFLPTMKLIVKTHIGSKIIKKYDKPKTPYQRVLDSPSIPEDNKNKLVKQYKNLNPAELKRQIDALQRELINYQKVKRNKNICVLH